MSACREARTAWASRDQLSPEGGREDGLAQILCVALEFHRLGIAQNFLDYPNDLNLLLQGWRWRARV